MPEIYTLSFSQEISEKELKSMGRETIAGLIQGILQKYKKEVRKAASI